MHISTKAQCYLVLVALIWGLTFPLIHQAVGFLDPDVFVFVRFCMAALFFLPFVISLLRKTSKLLLYGSLLLGLGNSVVYIFQSIGLMTIPASRSAFITGTGVILVPFLSFVLKIEKMRLMHFVCAILCCIGLYILTGADFAGFNVGDLYTFGCAIAYALTVIIIQILSESFDDPRLIVFYQMIFTIPIAGLLSIGSDFTPLLLPGVYIPLIFCAVLATCLVYYWQLRYQQYTTAPKAALIYALEPVFASIFSISMHQEALTWTIVIGGGFIFGSIILPDMLALLGLADKRKKK